VDSLGLAETQQIARWRFIPPPDIVYVAAQGHAFGPNPERGVYKTIDGARPGTRCCSGTTPPAPRTWSSTGEPGRALRRAVQAVRRPWTLVSGGAGSGLFKSTDAREHWTEITKNPGLPTGLWGNIGIAVSPAKPARVWALIEADSGGVCTGRTNSGSTWKHLNSDHNYGSGPGYYSKIFCRPQGFEHRVGAGGQPLQVHGRRGHVPPRDRSPWRQSRPVIASNGRQSSDRSERRRSNVSFNGGKTWTDQTWRRRSSITSRPRTTSRPRVRRPAGQLRVCGPSRWPGGIDRGQWYDVSGESGYIQARPDNPTSPTVATTRIPWPGRPQDQHLPLHQSVPDSPDGHRRRRGSTASSGRRRC